MMEEFLLKHTHTKEIKLDIRKVILLNKFSTMDLLWNSGLVENVAKVGKKMKLKGNSGTLLVTHKATLTRYKQDV